MRGGTMNHNQEKIEQQRTLADFQIIHKTRGNTTIQGKPLVFISYDLRDKYLLENICDDFLSIADCAVLFSEDANIPFKSVVEITERIDLLVMCITSNYLNGTEVFPEEEIQYANIQKIPILPLLMEGDVDVEYNRRFPQIHYLKTNTNDLTEIPYRKKLSDYLSAVLINDELFAKIRDAFDAYIFLSYRKKDRKYAQELMRLIHSNPFCREVAIWYDEYLVPGEDFSDAIKKMIEDSHLFTMVVTPNILEDGNYVIREEYPFASITKKNILPISMAKTDEKRLQKVFPGISRSVDGRNHALSESLTKTMSELASKPREGDPRHTFFIGLAYLFGINMEEDNEMGLSLITKAAEDGLPEAAKKIGQLYRYGQGVERDICVAINWQKKYRNLLKVEYQDILDDRIHVLIEAENDLAEMELEICRIKDARNTCWRGIKLCRSNGGRGAFYSTLRIKYYAKLYMLLGDVFLKRCDEKQAIECYERDLEIYITLLKNNPNNLEIALNTSRCLFKLHDMGRVFGDWYYDTVMNDITSILNINYDSDMHLMLAKCYKVLGNYSGFKSKIYYEKSLTICLEIVKKHKNVDTLSILVDTYIALSKWCLSYKKGHEAEKYIQKALTVCNESIGLHVSSTGYRDLLRCYYQKVAILRRQDNEESLRHLSSNLPLQLTHLYDEVQKVMAILEEKYPGYNTDLFALKTYATFYEFCTTEKAIEAYDKVLAIVRYNPILYYRDYISSKQTLWKYEKLTERVYQNYIAFNVLENIQEKNAFFVFNRSENMRISVYIVDEPPYGTVCQIKISEDVLLRIRSCYSDNAMAYTSCHQIQICKVDGKFEKYCKMNPTPEEYVYLLIKTSVKVEAVKYIQCYG